jgi:hypothetical protein
MIAAFQRWLKPPHSVSMVMDVDGSWSHLKLDMCSAWDIEQGFDENEIWAMLREGDTVLFQGALYCVFSQDWDDASGATPFRLFEPTRGQLRIVDTEW